FRIDNVFVLPGVPQIMQAIFSELKHRLKGGAAVLSRSVSCTLAEGTIAKDLGELQTRYADLEIASYPYFRRRDFGVTLVSRGRDVGCGLGIGVGQLPSAHKPCPTYGWPYYPWRCAAPGPLAPAPMSRYPSASRQGGRGDTPRPR